MLRFVATEIPVPDLDTHLSGYQLEEQRPEISAFDTPYVQAEVDGRHYELLGSVVERMVEFQSDPDKRTRLNQDCGAFALSCVNNVDLSKQRIGPFKTVRGEWTYIERNEVGSSVAPGEAVVTLFDTSTDGPKSQPHVMVRASTPSVDAGAPVLWASKLSRQGTTALHTFKAAGEVYPQEAIGHISRLILAKVSLREAIADQVRSF